MLTDKQKYNILKGYLGRFFVLGEVREISAIRQNLSADVVAKRDVLFRGDRDQFNSAMCYYLLCGGRKQWREVSACELADVFFRRDMDEGAAQESIFSYSDPYLILTLGIGEANNGFFWNILNQFLAWRQVEGLRTCVYNFSRSFQAELEKKLTKSTYAKFLVLELDSAGLEAEGKKKSPALVSGGLVV